MDRTFSTEELAERYHTSPRTVADWRYKGTGPDYFFAGRRATYSEAAVLAWEKKREAERLARKRAS